jgi:hypothetical protein
MPIPCQADPYLSSGAAHDSVIVAFCRVRGGGLSWDLFLESPGAIASYMLPLISSPSGLRQPLSPPSIRPLLSSSSNPSDAALGSRIRSSQIVVHSSRAKYSKSTMMTSASTSVMLLLLTQGAMAKWNKLMRKY